MDGQGGVPPLDGEVWDVPFTGASLSIGVKDAYRQLRTRQDVDTVLVLTRSGDLVETVEMWLDEAGAASATAHTDVQSLTAHAAQIRSNGSSRNRIATRNEYRITLATVAAEFDWGRTEFLQQASQQESFLDDLAPLVTAILTQDIRQTEDPDLAVIIDFAYDVEARLESTGRIDLSRAIHRANEKLAAGADLPSPTPDAVLVVNFEEYTDREREYIAYISHRRPLICLTQEASSLYRVGEEPGDPRNASGLERANRGPAKPAPQSQSEAVATRLATGHSHTEEGELTGAASFGEVVQLEGETFESHVRGIGDEIHRLHDHENVQFDEMAVAVRDTRAPISDVVRLLWTQNVPVSSTSVSGLEYDAAARELYNVIQAIVARRAGRPITPELRRPIQTRLEDVERDVDVSALLDGTMEAAVDAERFDDALAAWIGGTDLKGRIASSQEPLQARISFENVEQVLEISRFIEDNGVCHTWEAFQDKIEFIFDQSAGDRLSDDLESANQGVRVDTVRALKGDRRDAVFVVGVVEGEFPTDVPSNPLFPRARATAIDNFPLLVDLTPEDVLETFPAVTSADEFTDPVRAYYAALDRRLLAVAAQAARQHLYLGTYRQDPSGLSKFQPSRFLTVVADEATLETRDVEDRVRSPAQAIVAAFDESRHELLLASSGEPVDRSILETRFGAVQSLLADHGDYRTRDALRTRIELTKGEIRRQTPNPEAEQ